VLSCFFFLLIFPFSRSPFRIFFFHVFFLLSFFLTTFLFSCFSHIRVIHFISELLDEVELDKQGIEDLVNMKARRYQGEVDHLTL
jgi:hypothetical protein